MSNFFACVLSTLLVCSAQPSAPRLVRISGTQFVSTSTGQPIVLAGPNVVVKGPPYLPSISGSHMCEDVVDEECTATGSCTSCSTFNGTGYLTVSAASCPLWRPLTRSRRSPRSLARRSR